MIFAGLFCSSDYSPLGMWLPLIQVEVLHGTRKFQDQPDQEETSCFAHVFLNMVAEFSVSGFVTKLADKLWPQRGPAQRSKTRCFSRRMKVDGGRVLYTSSKV